MNDIDTPEEPKVSIETRAIRFPDAPAGLWGSAPEMFAPRAAQTPEEQRAVDQFIVSQGLGTDHWFLSMLAIVGYPILVVCGALWTLYALFMVYVSDLTFYHGNLLGVTPKQGARFFLASCLVPWIGVYLFRLRPFTRYSRCGRFLRGIRFDADRIPAVFWWGRFLLCYGFALGVGALFTLILSAALIGATIAICRLIL